MSARYVGSGQPGLIGDKATAPDKALAVIACTQGALITLIGTIGAGQFRIDVRIIVGMEFGLYRVGAIGNGHLQVTLAALLRHTTFGHTKMAVR